MADTIGGLGGLGGLPVGDSALYSQDQSQSILDYLLSKLTGIGHGVAEAAKYPGDVYAGRKQLNDPETGRTSDDAVGKAFDLAGLASLGAAPTQGGTVNMGIRAYHGSPRDNLTRISADPPVRQFDNATSQLGAFFSPNEAGASRYKGPNGKTYEVDLNLNNPYEMPVSEFLRLQAPNKGPDGALLPGEQWAARAEQLRQEAAEMRKRLAAQGHDGAIIRDTKGNVKEIASFRDVSEILRKYGLLGLLGGGAAAGASQSGELRQ
jgi:hypothetical protein